MSSLTTYRGSEVDVLGIHVPETSPVFLAFLAVHVLAALAAVIAGAGAALVRRKSRGRHTRFGGVYFWAICVVFASATALAAMRLREDYHLFLIGAAAFAAAYVGRLARRRHWSGDRAHIIGMGGSYVAMLTAFYVDNGHQLPLWDRLPTPAYWLLPAAVGAPLIWRATRRASGAVVNDAGRGADQGHPGGRLVNPEGKQS
ncbi:hypothetical protein ABZ904_17130 [Streptomyces sp. NPDC046900]|uniref:hypothetical protein n=1 Tax=Streptomyces sp. NPDC046900 TaxID=3155473 RepID=UPI0034009F48